MYAIHHRYADIDGQRLFYREAGPAGAPAVLLLHGFPASSFMFRNLIPLLADRYHVIALDHLGFGLSGAPPTGEFTYTCGGLAGLTAALLVQLKATRYAMYVQDYDAPIGWRLALANPAAVTAIVTQNGNGYEAGFTEGFWKPVREYWRDPNPQAGAALREALTLEAIRWQYLHGVPDETVVSPDTWYHDYALVSRPGNDLVQLALFADYATNLPLYPRLHAYLRDSRVPLLAVWGANDEIFGPDGAPRSPATRPAPRSTCSTAVTSCSKASSTPKQTSSAASSKRHCHDRQPERPDRADHRAGRRDCPRRPRTPRLRQSRRLRRPGRPHLGDPGDPLPPRLWRAVPCFPSISEAWPRLLEAYRG
jgi:pimeloyl-ACP methyl ester carboxylesterase